MGLKSKISILGLYNYNEDVFSGLNVPDGMDKQVVVNNILMQCAELELLFPSYTFMKMAIGNWSSMEANIWEKMWQTETVEYNPIWNVDATIEEKGTADGIGSTKGYNFTDWLENSKTDTEDTRTTRRTGNIGVTTTQQMIEAERDVANFSTVDFITNSFKKRFCLMVY